jgi:hypothetical protein
MAALEPVPLDFGTRRVLDLDRGPAVDSPARLAVGPQVRRADRPGEGGVAARVAQRDDLVEQRRQPEVRVVNEAGREIGDERGERIRDRGSPRAGRPFAPDVGTDRLAVALEVAGDGRDRPASPGECVDLHVVSLCEHRRGLLRRCGFDTVSIGWGPAPCLEWTVVGPFQVLRPGEFQ